MGTIAHIAATGKAPPLVDNTDRIKEFYGEILHNRCNRFQYFSQDLFLEDFAKLTSYLRKAPERITYFEVVSITPETTSGLFGDPITGLAYVLESVSSGWAYSHIFKLRGYCNGLLQALEHSSLLVAALCARAIFEHAAFFNYFFEKCSYTAF